MKGKTRLDKVLDAMKGSSWEEGKDIGIAILARYVAFKVHMDGDIDYMELLEEIATSADKWVTEQGGSFVIAMAKASKKG